MHVPSELPAPVPPIIIGAERIEQYEPLLAGKRIGMVVNHTSRVGDAHLVDFLLARKLDLQLLFAPEHGFRGTASAGEQIVDGRDVETGLPIRSLYGKSKKPAPQDVQQLDIIVFDIQDVGARFYTYISTLSYVLEAAAENGVPVLVLDRPNPHGNYVDGPMLDPDYQSFVGLHRLPVVHGLTVGEYAQLINTEGWLADGVQCDLTVIPCANYDHQMTYKLPIAPSPNLPDQQSIYLYPSLCFFEGTSLSIGRGTDLPFQVIGSPSLAGKYPFSFTPQGNEGAKDPKHENETCHGVNLSNFDFENGRPDAINLAWLLELYHAVGNAEAFFSRPDFFDKLAGTNQLRQQITAGMTATEIRATWQTDLQEYRALRQKYVLYRG